LDSSVFGVPWDLFEDAEDDAFEVALERPHRLLAGLALGLPASQVGLGRQVHPALGQGDAVQGEVELAVAGPVQAVALLLPRGDVERRRARQSLSLTGHCDRGLGAAQREKSRPFKGART
jgi:hypothetical protein